MAPRKPRSQAPGKSRKTRNNTADKSVDTVAPGPDGEKLQKVLARTGKGSRREMERWIQEGRIAVNGQQATLGDRVGIKDRIAIDGRLLEVAPAQETRQAAPDWARTWSSP